MKKQLLLLFLFISPLIKAQEIDTLHWLKQIDVKGSRITYPDKSIPHQVLDTAVAAKILSADVGAQLTRESGVFVKSYGQGGISTITSSGMGAAHTALLWNGIKLNSSMLGLYDFSLMPSFLLDKVTMQYGGSGALQGSGSVGGAVLLESETAEGFSVSAMAGLSSFGGQQMGIQTGLTNGNVSTNSRVYMRRAKNDIIYKNQYGESVTQKNANSEQEGFSQELKLGKEHNNLALHIWYLNSDYKIPPHMLQEKSYQQQKDEAQRYALTWNFKKEKSLFTLNAGFVQDKIRYIDSTALLDERSRARSYQADAMYSIYPIQNWQFDFRVSAEKSQATTDAYPKEEKLNQISGTVRVGYNKGKINSNVALRNGLTHGDALPLLPSIGINYQITKALRLRAEGAMVYRVPTLNDQYWQPGGNPYLQPEKGREASGGLLLEKKVKQISIIAEAGVFDILLDDAIIWFPQTGGVYGVENIEQIHSNGINGSIGMNAGRKKWKGEIQLRPQWNNSIITKTNAVNISSLNKQQIYTPKVLFKGKASISYQKIKVNYYINYSGYRYTLTNNSNWLDPYFINDLAISYERNFLRLGVVFTAAANNLNNVNYQVIANRAMPGRNYQLGMQVRFSGNR